MKQGEHRDRYGSDGVREHPGRFLLIVPGVRRASRIASAPGARSPETVVRSAAVMPASLPVPSRHPPCGLQLWDGVELALRRDPGADVFDTHLIGAGAGGDGDDYVPGTNTVRRKLDELGVTRDTIVVWFHDNGPNGVRWNGGMRGRKGSTDEGGVRSPLYLRWPARIKAGAVVPQIASVRDLLPTLCDLAGVPTTNRKPLDGVSLKQLLEKPGSTADSWPDRVLINQWKNKISVRNQRFRLDDKTRLYDMVADPGQKTNVAARHPKVVEELGMAAARHREEFMPTYFEDKRPFVIAHPGSRYTQLPARDAVVHGAIERSNRFPNCSYFRNWTSTEDRINFNAEVAAGGTYRVVLYYAAKEAGAQCELSFNNATLKFEIAEAHDVPKLGAEHDLHPRMESYVKDFKAMTIGKIVLEKGKGELTLRATEIPGAEAMEFRLLTLERM